MKEEIFEVKGTVIIKKGIVYLREDTVIEILKELDIKSGHIEAVRSALDKVRY